MQVSVWLIQETTACYLMLRDCIPIPSDNAHNINNITLSPHYEVVQAAQAFSCRWPVKSINPKSNGTEGQEWHSSLCRQSRQIPGPVFYKKKPKTHSLYKLYKSSPGHFQLLPTAEVISLTFCVRHVKRSNTSSGKQPLWTTALRHVPF